MRQPLERHEESDPLIAPRVSALREAGVRIVGLRRGSRLGSGLDPAGQAAAGERIDVLHSHQFGSNLWASILGRIAATPVVIAHEHNWSFDGEPLRRVLDRHVIANRADAFLAVSRQTRQAMIELEGIDPEQVRFVPLGIATPPAGPRGRRQGRAGDQRGRAGDRDRVHPAPGEGPRRPDPRGGCAARRFRGHAGADRRRRPRPRARRGIGRRARSGSGREPARRAVATYPTSCSALDVAVCSSDWEGSPLSVMEYMEAELPVVATRVGGIPDMIETGVEGVLVAPGDPEAMAAAIGELLRDPARGGRDGPPGAAAAARGVRSGRHRSNRSASSTKSFTRRPRG